MAKPSLRERIVDAALTRLHEHGFNASSVQDITDLAGAPKGSFYNHFKTKDLLAAEALARYQEGSGMGLLFEGSQPPLARIRRHFEFLAGQQEQWGFSRGCLMGNFSAEMAFADPTMREKLANSFENWSAAVALVLRQAQQRDEIQPAKDVDRLARYLVNAWQGALIRMKVMRSREPLDDFFAAFDAVLL
jgi:TetR/AcrR family transcriptional repressor of nem operon